MCGLAWYGKLSNSREYVESEYDFGVKNMWETWFQQGLKSRGLSLLAKRKNLEVKEPYFFWMNLGTNNRFLVGMLQDSHDKIGRCYPFVMYKLFNSVTDEMLVFPFTLAHFMQKVIEKGEIAPGLLPLDNQIMVDLPVSYQTMIAPHKQEVMTLLNQEVCSIWLKATGDVPFIYSEEELSVKLYSRLFNN